MKLRALMSLRFVRRHPWHGVLSIIGISLGISVVLAIDITNESARRALRLSNAAITSGSTHYIAGGPRGVDERFYTELRVKRRIRNIRPVVSGHVSLKGRRFVLLGVDPFAGIASGRFAQPGNDMFQLTTVHNAVLMLQSSAAELAIDVPATLTAEISGLAHDLRVIGVLQPENEIQQLGLRNVMLTDISTAQSILGMVGRLSRIDVDTDAPEKIKEQLPSGLTLIANDLRSRTTEQMTRAFHLNLTALSLLALVIGAFLIYNTMTLSILQRRETFALLRALGMTSKELFTDILLEALVLAALGLLLGSLLGVWFSTTLLRLVSDTINNLYFTIDVRSISVPPQSLLNAGVLALAATTISVSHPAWEAMRTSPAANALRSSVELEARLRLKYLSVCAVCLWCAAAALLLWTDRSIVAGFAALFLIIIGFALITPLLLIILLRLFVPVLDRQLGVIGRMAGRGVRACLSRTQIAVAALAIAISAVVGVSVMISSFRQSVEHWLDNFLRADVYIAQQQVHLQSGIDYRLIDSISVMPEVESVSTGRWTSVESESGVTQLFALDVSRKGFRSFQLKSADSDSIWPRFIAQDVVIVSESYAYHHDLGVGDVLTIPAEREKVKFEIAGIYYDYGTDRGVVTMHRDTYNRHWNDAAITSFALYLKQGIEADSFVDQLNENQLVESTLRVRSNKTLREKSLQVFDRTFIITDVLRLLAIGIAIIGILSALMAIQLERAKEFAVLRAVGLGRGQLWALVTTESGLMGLIAGIIACPLGLIMAWVLILIINRRSFGWTMQFYFDPEPWITALLLSTAAALLAGLYPALRMIKAQPGLALKYE